MLQAAIIVDNMSVAKWQMKALESALDQIEVKLVLSCTNTAPKRDYVKNILYYILNYFTLRNGQTKRIYLNMFAEKTVSFESIYEGNWQKIPSKILGHLAIHNIDVVIKFGMNLLRVDEELIKHKTLSFHHGDPSCFRGRPAGFYEILSESSSVGIIVQEISNEIDSGRVWALAKSKVHKNSYRKTAISFYRNSEHLLRKAIINLQNDNPIEIASDGVIYSLPGNGLVMKFLLATLLRAISNFLYGAFIEKKWNVGVKDYLEANETKKINLCDVRCAKIPPKYIFYADPFFSRDGDIRLEALDRITGFGEITEIDIASMEQKYTCLKGAHYSYPFSFFIAGKEFIMPEVATHSPHST